jgi:hypothetical protein
MELSDSDQDIHQKEDDAYAEDDLPDLGLFSRAIKFDEITKLPIYRQANFLLLSTSFMKVFVPKQ